MIVLVLAISATPLLQDLVDVNKALKKKPMTSKFLAEQLGKADEALNDKGFDAEYQAFRKEAFDTSFAAADEMKKKAAPAVEFQFDGDSDKHQLVFKVFKSLAPKGSEAEAFFKEYQKLNEGAPGLDGWFLDCAIQFDITIAAFAGEPRPQDKARLLAKWKTLGATWKEPFFKDYALRAVECLSK